MPALDSRIVPHFPTANTGALSRKRNVLRATLPAGSKLVDHPRDQSG